MTQQCKWMALVSIVTQQGNHAVSDFHSNEVVDYQLLFQSGVRHGEGQLIVGASVVLCGTSLSVDAFTAAA
jgi:hypothetical protein